MLDIKKKQLLSTTSLQLTMTTRCFIQGISLIENWQTQHTAFNVQTNVIFFLNNICDTRYFEVFLVYISSKSILILQNCDQNNIRDMLELHLICSKLLAEYVIIHSIVV